jgi:spermidine synthase
VGQVFGELRRPGPNRIAVIGLGIGGLAAYSEPREHWTFFEIDPAIAELARDQRQFTFLSDSPADMRIVLGDARIALTKEPDRSYDMLVLDAFSSDAIPVHLLTREALQLYLQKLNPGGLLVFHISNRYLNLAPLVAELARDAGLAFRVRFDKEITAEAAAQGTVASQWAVMARSPETLGSLLQDARWKSGEPGAIAWTDDFSNPLSVMQWFGK